MFDQIMSWARENPLLAFIIVVLAGGGVVGVINRVLFTMRTIALANVQRAETEAKHKSCGHEHEHKH